MPCTVMTPGPPNKPGPLSVPEEDTIAGSIVAPVWSALMLRVPTLKVIGGAPAVLLSVRIFPPWIVITGAVSVTVPGAVLNSLVV